jgi:hypothetical protein
MCAEWDRNGLDVRKSKKFRRLNLAGPSSSRVSEMNENPVAGPPYPLADKASSPPPLSSPEERKNSQIY